MITFYIPDDDAHDDDTHGYDDDGDDTDAYDDDDDLVARDSIGRVRPSLSPSWQLCRLYWGGQPCQDAAWDGDFILFFYWWFFICIDFLSALVA